MGKWYVKVDGKYHTTRTNIAGCQTECGKTLVSGAALLVNEPALGVMCETCVQKPAYTGGGPVVLPHYLEKQNERLKEIIEETATSMDLNNMRKSAEVLRKKLKDASNAFAS